MRHLYIVIDLSTCMTEKDLKPNRLVCVIRVNNNNNNNITVDLQHLKDSLRIVND